MQALLLIPVVYLAAVAETTLVDSMRVGEIAPELLALVAAVWLTTVGRRWSFLTAGAIALVGDLLAPGRLGVGAAWMLLVGYGVTRLRSRLPLDQLAVQVPAVFAMVTVWALAVSAGQRLLGDVPLPWAVVPLRAAAVGAYTAGMALPVLMVIGWLREPRLSREKKLAEL